MLERYRVRLTGPFAAETGNLCTHATGSRLLFFQNGLSEPIEIDESSEQLRGRRRLLQEELCRTYGTCWELAKVED